MWKIQVTRQFFEANRPLGHFFAKRRKVSRYGLGEYVSQISGLDIFFGWSGGLTQCRQTDRQTQPYTIFFFKKDQKQFLDLI